jgi:photosystem II stability/assembly factor-like uncharacterized protein
MKKTTLLLIMFLAILAGDAFAQDTTPPTLGLVSDGVSGDIDFQTSTIFVDANWSGFSDPETGITDYQWGIGTHPGADNVQAFASVGTGTTGTTSVASLFRGQIYYITVIATNGQGLTTTASSNGFLVNGYQFDQQGRGPAQGGINDVDMFTATSGIAVGNRGVLLGTEDGGQTWERLRSETAENLYGVQILSATDAIVVGATGTILRTTDKGNTWYRINVATTQVLRAVSFQGSTGYICGFAGEIFKSTDNGFTWTSQTSGSTRTPGLPAEIPANS